MHFILKLYLIVIICAKNGYSFTADCSASTSSSVYRLTEVEQGGTIRLHIETEDVIRNTVIGLLSENDSWVSVILSANSEGNVTYYNTSYTNRATVVRSGTRHAVTIVIRDVRSADGGTYLIKAEGHHKSYELCNRVYVLGLPTTPNVSLVAGGPGETNTTFTKIQCLSNSTTKPFDHHRKLIYTFKVNGKIVNHLSHGDSRYMVSGNMLMIGHNGNEKPE